MEVNIRPKNFSLTGDIEDHIRTRIERLPRHLDSIESAEVLLSQQPTHLSSQRFQYVAQLTLNTRNNLIRSEVRDPELLTAVDQALDHLSRQVERFKGRQDRRRKGSPGLGKAAAEVIGLSAAPIDEPSVVEMAAPAALDDNVTATSGVDASQGGSSDVDEDDMGGIVRVKRFSVQPMFSDEAIEQMELLGHSFFVFWDAGEERMSVLYRRNDGDYGLLQPELS